MGKMMDFHIHRKILDILGEMAANLSGGKKQEEARDPREYLPFFAQLRAACREYGFSQAQLLERLTGILEKAARKGRLPVKNGIGG